MLVGLDPDQLEAELCARDAPAEVCFPVSYGAEIVGHGIERAASDFERLVLFGADCLYSHAARLR